MSWIVLLHDTETGGLLPFAHNLEEDAARKLETDLNRPGVESTNCHAFSVRHESSSRWVTC